MFKDLKPRFLEELRIEFSLFILPLFVFLVPEKDQSQKNANNENLQRTTFKRIEINKIHNYSNLERNHDKCNCNTKPGIYYQ
jgi:hypothetical protein